MLPVKSRIARGGTIHTRFHPIQRSFIYRLDYLLINLKESKKLNNLIGFKWNQSRFFSLSDATYLTGQSKPILTQAKAFMAEHAPDIAYHDIYLLTTPRFFSMNFNPVSFFYFLDTDGKLCAVIAEVHNTFKEKHLYLLRDPIEKPSHLFFKTQKVFHVSPFFEPDGTYRFLFSKNIANIDISIHYYKGTQKMFYAQLKLKTARLTKTSFIGFGASFIRTALSTFPRILYQATILKLKHKLAHIKKPPLANDALTFSRQSSSWFNRLAMKKIVTIFSKIQHGHLDIILPDGTQHSFGDKTSDTKATIHVTHYGFFSSLLLKQDIGFADAYINGHWNTPNLEHVFEIFILNNTIMNQPNPIKSVLSFINRTKHRLRKNTISNAKKNIFTHYDLGNDFFNLFLDKHRVYSSAIFESPKQSLADAQINKINHILSLANIEPHHRVLEIGSGWGALAIHAAQTIGCHVTTVTISDEQYNYVKRLINRLHLDHKVEVKLMDYRHLTGKYDRIVSVEMLEAVGHDYLPTFFKKIHGLLHRKGQAAFQCIMIPEHRYASYLKNPDFIQTHIFPGGHLPHLDGLKNITNAAGFSWQHTDTITSHYVPTLNQWEIAFNKHRSDIHQLGFDDHFFNTWIYYFNYCSAGFKHDYVQNHQFLIEKNAA